MRRQEKANHIASDVRTGLTFAELDTATGGGSRSKPKGSDQPRETLSLTFTRIQFSDSGQ